MSVPEPRLDALRILTHIGADAEDVASVMRSAASEELAHAGRADAFVFEEPVHDANGLARVLIDRRATILHVASHANETGAIGIEGFFDRVLRLEPAQLARMLSDKGIRVAVLMTCFGARIAKTLVEAGVVDMAVGSTIEVGKPVAAVFVRGFYASLARGMGPAAAADDAAKTFAEVQAGSKWDGEFEVHTRPNAVDDPLVDQPLVTLIGERGEAQERAVVGIREAMAPYEVHDTSLAAWGDEESDALDRALRRSRIIILLTTGDRVRDKNLLDQVTTAVAHARRPRPPRLFPLYLEGTSADLLHIPMGLRRLHPAFFTDPRIGGSYTKFAELLKELVARDLTAR